jgi:hypothetical protein
MSCTSNTSLSGQDQLSLLLSDTPESGAWSLSFSGDMSYLIATSWDAKNTNSPGNTTLNMYDGMRICLESGVYITQDSNGNTNINSLDAIAEGALQACDFFLMSGEFNAGQIDREHTAVKVGGCGIIDIMATDPAHFTYYSQPWTGPGTIMLEGVQTDIQSLGVFLHRIRIIEFTANFTQEAGAPSYDFTKVFDQTKPNSSVLVLGLVYELANS